MIPLLDQLLFFDSNTIHQRENSGSGLSVTFDHLFITPECTMKGLSFIQFGGSLHNSAIFFGSCWIWPWIKNQYLNLQLDNIVVDEHLFAEIFGGISMSFHPQELDRSSRPQGGKWQMWQGKASVISKCILILVVVVVAAAVVVINQ